MMLTRENQAEAPSAGCQRNNQRCCLSVKDLQVWFELKRFGVGHAGYVKAVDGVTFDLHQGEAIAVVGESGCGKSSLMKTILGLVPAHRWQGVSSMGSRSAAFQPQELRWYRSQVGYIQQDPYGALPPFMTVERILEEPLSHQRHQEPRRDQRAHPQDPRRRSRCFRWMITCINFRTCSPAASSSVW